MEFHREETEITDINGWRVFIDLKQVTAASRWIFAINANHTDGRSIPKREDADNSYASRDDAVSAAEKLAASILKA
jgi:hypothetical protein